MTTPCSKITTAAPEAITGLLLVLLLVLSLLVQVLLVLHLLVRFLLVLHLLVRTLVRMAPPVVELCSCLVWSRTQLESNSASATRPFELTNVRCTMTVARRPNDLPYDITTAAATR